MSDQSDNNEDFNYAHINQAVNQAKNDPELEVVPLNAPYYENNNFYYGQGEKPRDIELALSGGSNTIHQSLRLGFIRKVYGILAMQLMFTVFMCALTFIEGVRMFYLTNAWLFFLCIFLSLAVIIPVICIRSLARTVPQNYILVGIWTFCEAYMVATCCSFYDPIIVVTAASLTCAVTVALTFYACTTKTDFTVCGGFLFVALCLLICFGLFSIFCPILKTFYCIVGVLIYSIYLLYDTQLIMGKFGNEYQIDDYIIAAVMIYIDIIQIFLYLLQLLGDKRN